MNGYALLTVPPTDEPVSLDEAKAQLRVSGTVEDALIGGYIAAARGLVEDITGRSLMPQTWRLDLDGISSRIWLPKAAPVSAVTGITYVDSDGATQTLSTSAYRLQSASEPAFVEWTDAISVPSLASRSDAVKVTYTAGYASADLVPAQLRQACLLLVAHFFANREPVAVGTIATALPMGVEALCARWRVEAGSPGVWLS
jgi:uncharacterized phiE125 gp8 family phage protein